MSKANKVQRVDPSGPLQQQNMIMNSKGLADRSLFYVCVNLRKRLEKVPGLQQYLRIAYITATTTNEEQACALSQNSQRRISGTNSELSARRKSDENGFSPGVYNYYTFASGMLPANVLCDPVTQIWKLFQQGAALCVVYNAVSPGSPLPIVLLDDLKICKRSVYDFLLRCKEDLNLRDEDMFPISSVFSSSTNDLLKVILMVNIVLDLVPNFMLSELEKQDVFLQAAVSKDARYNVVRELVETERKYVQDLEIMLDYKNELRQAELVPLEQLHLLFPNLNEILDVHRRLLVGLEANAIAPPKLQRIGSIFLHSFEPFKVYEPWTVGQKSMREMFEAEMPNLERSSQIIQGGLELDAFLTKPIQRLCRYPLFFKELIKYTDRTWPHYNELVAANQAVKETADHVNEVTRKYENLGKLKELQERVADWKGYDIHSFGDLLYDGNLGVRDSDTEREFNVFLFEQIILFFKEAVPKEAQKKSKKKNSLAENTNKHKLELKGRIYIPNIYNILLNLANNSVGHLLTVSWSGSRDSGSFVMRFKNEEMRSQWENCLRDMVNRIRDEFHENDRYSMDRPSSSSEHGYGGSRFRQTPGEKMRNNSSASSYFSAANGSGTTMVNGSGILDDARSRAGLSPSLLKNGNSLASPLAGLNLGTPTGMNGQHLPLNGGRDPGTPVTLSSDDCIKIKLSYKQDIFTLLVPHLSELAELKRRIEKKLKQCGALITLDTMKIRYQDEEGDYIAIDSEDDWLLAQEVVEEIMDNNGDNILSIWVIQL